MPIHEDHREAFSNLGLMQQVVSSSDPQWTQSDHTPRKRNLRKTASGVSTNGLSDIALSDSGSPTAGAHANGHVSPAGLPLAGTILSQSMPCCITQSAVYGCKQMIQYMCCTSYPDPMRAIFRKGFDLLLSTDLSYACLVSLQNDPNSNAQSISCLDSMLILPCAFWSP